MQTLEYASGTITNCVVCGTESADTYCSLCARLGFAGPSPWAYEANKENIDPELADKLRELDDNVRRDREILETFYKTQVDDIERVLLEETTNTEDVAFISELVQQLSLFVQETRETIEQMFLAECARIVQESL